MIYNKTTWCTEVQTKLHLAKESFKPKEIERSGIEYLSNLFTRIVSDEIELEHDLQRKIDTMMKEFPKKVAGRFLITSSYINQLSNIKKIIMKRYNLTYKGYNRTKYFSLGIGFGLGLGSSIGLLLGEIPISIPFGLAIGIAIGVSLGEVYERRASAQNRVL